MLSGRELRSSRTRRRRAGSTSGSSTPTASGSRWSPSTRSPPRASRPSDPGPAARVDRRRAGDHPAPDLLRRGPTPTTSSCAPGRPSSTSPGHTSGRRGPDETRWTGDTGVPLDTTLNRLLFALRFRDLDLLICDQVTADSQLLFHRTMGDRLRADRAVPRFDKDPYLVIDDTATSSTSRTRTRSATGSRTRMVRPGAAGRRQSGLGGSRSTTSATASRSRWTPTTGR